MCPKYVILIVLYFCLQFMSVNYFDILFCDFSLCDLCLCFLCCFYVTKSALQVHLQPFAVFDFVKSRQFSACSLNVRGLSNEIKRRENFNWLRNKKYSVHFLQEVHSSKEMEKLWLAEWGYRGLFSSLSSSRAVCPSYLTTIFLLRFKNNFRSPKKIYHSWYQNRRQNDNPTKYPCT